MITNGFKGHANRLTPQDMLDAAVALKVEPAALQAFVEVETAGSGFEMSDRPRMLFEPHIFYRLLPEQKLSKAISQGLAYKNWGTEPYPPNSYERLGKAIKIDENAALKACSWGLGQILGTNYAIVGYPSVRAMVRDFMDSEKAQLEAMVAFIVANGIDDDLRAKRWAEVARVYNGPAYARHGYHDKLRVAYERLAGVDRNSTGYPSLRIGARGFMVTHLQNKLHELRYHNGAVDGHFGKMTRTSVMAFQADHGLESTGVADPQTWDKLEHAASPRHVGDERMAATVDTLRKKGSSTIRSGDRGQAAGTALTLTGGLTAAGQYVGQAEQATGLLGRAQNVLSTFSWVTADLMPYLALGAGAAALYYFWCMKQSRVDDHRSGAHQGR